MQPWYALPDDGRLIVFTNTKRRVDHLANMLWAEGFGASAVHGDKPQAEREKALAQFARGEWPLMVATDVAARGLDVKDITHVVNVDFPGTIDDYVHRIGRTGRAGPGAIAAGPQCPPPRSTPRRESARQRADRACQADGSGRQSTTGTHFGSRASQCKKKFHSFHDTSILF